MDKKVTNTKGSKKTKMSKESILSKYKDDLIEIYNLLKNIYKIDSKSRFARAMKDIITECKNRDEVTLLNIHIIEENLEILIKEVDKNLYQSIVCKINFDK